MRHIILATALLAGTQAGQELLWRLQSSPSGERLRGVSAVSDRTAWVSGNRGTVLRTVDGGLTWTAIAVPDAETLDFRDIEAFDDSIAYVLAIGPGERSRIFKTTDGGRNWSLQFKNLDPTVFFDAMAFWDARSGIVMGDPKNGSFVIVRTFDGGETWIDVPARQLPPALQGEAAFAASGTCLTTYGRNHVWFGTGGGAQARVFRSTDRGLTWQVAHVPVAAGSPSAGIFSLAFRDAQHGVAVGGDYRQERRAGDNLAVTRDGGATWLRVDSVQLPGFRSAVAFVGGAARRPIVALGSSGSEFSLDDGSTWTDLALEACHAVSFAPSGATGWAVGEDGRIVKLTLPASPR